MYFFYIPLFYFFKIHARTKTRAVSWLFIFLVPVGILCYLVLDNNFNTAYFMVLLVLLYNIYEVGYIYNDCETTKNEVDPTYRLSNNQLEHYENNRLIIYVFRFLTTVSLLFLIFIAFDEPISTMVFLIIECFILSMVYFWYNSIRSRFNILVGTILGVLRYSFVPVLMYFSAYGVFSFELVFISFLIFPLVNVLTFLTKKKFKIYWAINLFVNQDKWRVVYYSVSVFLVCIMIVIDNQHLTTLTPSQLLIIFGYYFFIRCIYLFVLSRDSFISRSIKYARGLDYFSKERNDDK